MGIERSLSKVVGASKAIQQPVRLLHKFSSLQSWWRGLLFKAQVRLYGARLTVGQNVRFAHPIRFQGYGRVIFENHVTLGHRLGGAMGQPILLQPREAESEIRVGPVPG